MLKVNQITVKNRFVIVILAILFIDLIIFLNISFLRQILGFLFLTLLPGLLILQILKLKELSITETVLYSVGLSIAFIMFTGLFMNEFYPFIGFSKPLSFTASMITINFILLTLCYLSYTRNKDFKLEFTNIKDIFSPYVLALCLLPLLCILCTPLVGFDYSRVLSLFLLLFISILPLLIIFNKIPKKLYPLTVFIIAICLLYKNSLNSMYLIGCDIQYEHYFADMILKNQHWDAGISSLVNSMLSIVMLAPIYSIILNMKLTWVFKIIYPLIFSLVPVTVYKIVQKQISDKIAFLSCFFFMSGFTFYGEMLSLTRQQIAELFFILLILLMIDKKMDKMKRSILLIIFGVSLATSHYALSYFYMFFILSLGLILVLIGNPTIQKFFYTFARKTYELIKNQITSNVKDKTISFTFILIFTTFVISWYMFISGSVNFNIFVHLINHISSSFFSDFFNPTSRGAGVTTFAGMRSMPSITLEITRYMYYITQFFIIIGFIRWITKRSEIKLDLEYAIASYFGLSILLICVTVPHFASSLNMTRIYHIVLLIISPFCILGGETFFGLLSKLKLFIINVKESKNSIVNIRFFLTSLILICYFLSNTGLISVVVNPIADYIYPSEKKLEKRPSLAIHEQDDVCLTWALSHMDKSPRIYSGFVAHYTLVGKSFPAQIGSFRQNTKLGEKDYIFLNYENCRVGKIDIPRSTAGSDSLLVDINTISINNNKIYDIGCSIYK